MASSFSPLAVLVGHLCRWWRVCFVLTLLSLTVLHLNYPHSSSPSTASSVWQLPASLLRRAADTASASLQANHPRRSIASAPHWPFSPSLDVSTSHAAFLSLLSQLTGTPVEAVAAHEAVLLEEHAVASLHDWMDLYAEQPPAEYDVSDGGHSQRDLSIHVVSTGQQAALEAQLEYQGYSGWTAHSRWTREQLMAQRSTAARWMFPGVDVRTDSSRSGRKANAAPGNGTDADDGADIDEGRLNFMDHVDVLSAISASATFPPTASLSLVLESDAVLTPFFRRRIEWVAHHVPDDFTAVFVAGCLNLHVGLDQLSPPAAPSDDSSVAPCTPLSASGIIMSCTAPPHRPTPLLIPSVRSRCTSGYLVSAASAARILSAVHAVTRTQTQFVPISHTLNDAFALLDRTSNASVYQMEPPASYERNRLLHPTSRSNEVVPTLRAVHYNLPTHTSTSPIHSEAAPSAVTSPATALSHPSSLAVVRPTAECESACSWKRSLDSPILSRSHSKTGADWSSYISPTTFRDMADWVYWRHRAVLPPSDPLVAVNESIAVHCLTPGALIYVQTTMLGKFFDEVHPAITQPYFLITGSADTTVPGGWQRHLDANADGSPSMLLHWFGQNGNTSHPRFTTIPIGIPFPMTDALDLMLHGQNSLVLGEPYEEDRPGGGANASRYQPRIAQFRWDNPGDFDDARLLLLNFDVNTNPAERAAVYAALCGNSSAGLAGAPYAECVEKQRGTSQYYASMRAVYHRNSRYRFALSPPGNGMDCHRTWEAVYLGIVPVVKSGPLDALFADLPVLVVKQWEELSADMLRAQWERLSKKYAGHVMERLHFGYWRDIIVRTAVAAMAARGIAVDGSWTDLSTTRRRCWGREER